MEAAWGGDRGGGKKSRRRGSGPGVWNIESRRRPCSAALRPEGGAAPRSGSHGGVGAPPAEAQGRGSPPRAQPPAAPLGSARLLPVAQSASSERAGGRVSERASERGRGGRGGGGGARVLAACLTEGARAAPARPRASALPPRLLSTGLGGWGGGGRCARVRPRAARTKSAAGTGGLAPAPLAAELVLEEEEEEAGARSRGAAGGFRPEPASGPTLPIGLPAP